MVKKALSFKKLITNVLMADKQNSYHSRVMILKKISQNLKKKHSLRRLRNYVKRALDNMEIQKIAIRRKQSYRLPKKLFEKYLDKANKPKCKKTLQKKGKKIILKKSIKKNTSSNTVSTQQSSLNHNNKKLNNKNTKFSKTKKNKAILTNQKVNCTNSLPLFPMISLNTNLTINRAYQKRYPAIWQYFDDNNFNAVIKRSDGWYDYDPEASDIVEDEWQRYIINRAMNDVRSVKSGQWEYMVDFVNWKQTNIIHQNHKIRPIRRLDDKGIVTKNPYVN
jgi:hypothetical protein